MQDTDYKIQDTAYMPGRKIQDTETGYSVYSIENAGHKPQGSGYRMQRAICRIHKTGRDTRYKDERLKNTLYRIQDQDHSVPNTRYREP